MQGVAASNLGIGLGLLTTVVEAVVAAHTLPLPVGVTLSQYSQAVLAASTSILIAVDEIVSILTGQSYDEQIGLNVHRGLTVDSSRNFPAGLALHSNLAIADDLKAALQPLLLLLSRRGVTAQAKADSTAQEEIDRHDGLTVEVVEAIFEGLALDTDLGITESVLASVHASISAGIEKGLSISGLSAASASTLLDLVLEVLETVYIVRLFTGRTRKLDVLLAEPRPMEAINARTRFLDPIDCTARKLNQQRNDA